MRRRVYLALARERQAKLSQPLELKPMSSFKYVPEERPPARPWKLSVALEEFLKERQAQRQAEQGKPAGLDSGLRAPSQT